MNINQARAMSYALRKRFGARCPNCGQKRTFSIASEQVDGTSKSNVTVTCGCNALVFRDFKRAWVK